MINVMIVDDQSIIKEGLKMILDSTKDIKVVNLAANGSEALYLCQLNTPDIILMDIKMPVMDGVEATKNIKTNYPRTKIIILTTFDDDEYILEALKGGASGYLLKDASPTEIADAIRTVFKGEAMIQPKIATKMISHFTKLTHSKGKPDEKHKALTDREVEITLLIGQGKNNKEISEELFLTEGTVKNHISNIISKLELRDRTQIAIYAIKNDLLKT